jgi:hypothetical protein
LSIKFVANNNLSSGYKSINFAMPKSVLVLIFILFNWVLNAQNHLVGVQFGINNTSVTDKNVFKSKIGKNGFSGGITYDYLLKKKFALGVDLLYTQKGFGNYYIMGDPLDPVSGGNGTGAPGGITVIFFQYDYITIPISLSYKVGNKYYLFTTVGLAPSYLVSAKTYFEDSDNVLYSNNLNKFELSGQVGLGAGLKLYKNYHLYASVLKFQSFNGVSNSNYYVFSEITNYGYNFSLGFKYSIGK